MMLDLILNLFPEWLCRYKTPMSSKGMHAWMRIRSIGGILFVLLVTLCLGGFLLLIHLFWNVFIEHQHLDGFDVTFEALWWLSGAFVVGIVEWVLNEKRFRLSPKFESVKWFGERCNRD
jgi:hypothetical protein